MIFAFLPLINSAAEDKMSLKSVEEIKKIGHESEKDYKDKTGKIKYWGDDKIPEFIRPQGKILYEDNFRNFENWHHEGCGSLTKPETGIMQINCIGSKQGGEGCMAFCRKDFPDNICIEYDMKALSNREIGRAHV